ncbi:hypothetical protein CEXT_545781 [Caerostris extrusa]|uniref:LAGLIDADG homing endonuclease n=1 Tax=Caerostris extrusa TaxID=172846 RepID=A0AAV4SSH8_CAEEX|nr:hypothetical protein CEXT_545781 [Caerostris extrusa]
MFQHIFMGDSIHSSWSYTNRRFLQIIHGYNCNLFRVPLSSNTANVVCWAFFRSRFYDGTTRVTNSQGRYATHVFTKAAESVINDHDLSKFLFLYLAHLAVHSGNPYQFMQAPEGIAQFKYIDDVNKRIHAGIDTKLYQ